MEALLPRRFRGVEAGLPLFRLEDGGPLKRDLLQRYLSLAAGALGIPPTRMGSHSLRIGGATSMYLSLIHI
eukprot:8992428-Alexandrium_andersonii.AAC.1